MSLVDLVRRHGCNAKLKAAIMAARGWKRDDWYAHWPTFAPELEQAVRVSGHSPPAG